MINVLIPMYRSPKYEYNQINIIKTEIDLYLKTKEIRVFADKLRLDIPQLLVALLIVISAAERSRRSW